MEMFKDIKGYEGLYKISSKGNVVSFVSGKPKILKNCISGNGYHYVNLYKDKKPKISYIHTLIAKAFFRNDYLDEGLVVDHIDNNKLNNDISNLQLISRRENVTKESRGSSKYKGVSFRKNRNKWQASINISGKDIYLGSFNCETKAHLAYIGALKDYNIKNKYA